jgi:ABC-type lipoprotein release transport system permease subunit
MKPAINQDMGFGISLGVGLTLIPASQMIENMTVGIPGLTIQVPWTEIILVSGLAYAMPLLTPWLPAVQAAKVGPAKALRYELAPCFAGIDIIDSWCNSISGS